jgi:hypothetical protein
MCFLIPIDPWRQAWVTLTPVTPVTPDLTLFPSPATYGQGTQPTERVHLSPIPLRTASLSPSLISFADVASPTRSPTQLPGKSIPFVNPSFCQGHKQLQVRCLPFAIKTACLATNLCAKKDSAACLSPYVRVTALALLRWAPTLSEWPLGLAQPLASISPPQPPIPLPDSLGYLSI